MSNTTLTYPIRRRSLELSLTERMYAQLYLGLLSQIEKLESNVDVFAQCSGTIYADAHELALESYGAAVAAYRELTGHYPEDGLRPFTY